MTEQTIKQALRKYDDLSVQAILFDMEIDIETWSLVPKVKEERMQWQINYKERRSEQDFDEYFDIDKE